MSYQQKSPTVVPANPFSPVKDAEMLDTAMKGNNTDKNAIINVLCHRTNSQRLEIAAQFKTLFEKDLVEQLKSKLSGDFEDLITAMMTQLPQFYAKELHHAISGLVTNKETLIEILCTLSNNDIKMIRQAYEENYGSELVDDVKDDTSGTFKDLMVTLCNANRDESMHTDAQYAKADAQALFEAFEKNMDKDDTKFISILCQRNYEQLKLIFDDYQSLSGHDIEEGIKNEFSGDVKNALLAIVSSVKNQPQFFAVCLYQSMAGIGTNDRQLIRIVVTRCEIDMGDIKSEYQTKYDKSLADAIIDDTSGDYKKGLLALIGEDS